VVDAAGSGPALKMAMGLVARSGQITKVGWGPKPVEFSLDPLLQKSVRLQGVFSHTWRTWEAVLAMMAGGLLDMEAMLTHTHGISAWETAYRQVESREAVKAVLLPE